MRFEVLGPVRVLRDGQVVGPISELRRRLLAVLLVRADRTVPNDVLAQALWGDDATHRLGNNLQIHVSRLRQVLDRPERLISAPGGYLLTVGPDELDAEVFARLHTEARRTAVSGELDQAVAHFREALGLWRGRPYADVEEADVVAADARRLAEARLVAYEELFDAELARGRAREIVPELTELVTEYPLRERFIAQQMLALYRSGRRTRAEGAYRAARQRLAKELRAEPGPELRELAEAIRVEDPGLRPERADATVRAVTVRPGQLPPAPGAFFGREPELEQLEKLATEDPDGDLIVLTGMAGIGKTGLALRYAHQAADRFGDGQLYIDLCGHSSGPVLDPMTALGQLLRGLGADSRRGWETVADATADYRSILSGRKLLVLLDNAASEAQVRPLLPATPGCLTVITSRNRLSGLIAREGAQRIGLGELPPDAAHALLVRMIGPRRLDREPEAAAALIAACGGLPLALRVAAAQLADEPHRPLSDYVAELEEHGPATLALDDDEHSAVTAAFDLSYQRLDPATGQLFRRLGLVPGLDFTVDAVAALSGTTPPAARDAIRKLVNAHLLQEHSPGRYRFHDLLRDDARRRTGNEDSAKDRDDAMDRLFAWYYQGKMAALALRASTRRHPPSPRLPAGIPASTFGDAREAMHWMRSEFPNLAAAVNAAGARPEHAHWTWQLAIGLMLPMAEEGYINDVQAMAESSIAAARAAGDPRALANVLTEREGARHRVDLPVDTSPLTEALEHAEQAGDQPLLAYCLNVTAVLHMTISDLEVAERYLVRSLAIHRADGDKEGQARALGNLGVIAYTRGDLEQTEQRYADVLALTDSSAERLAALALPNLTQSRIMLGRLDGIDDLIERADIAVTQFAHRINGHLLRLFRCMLYRDTGRHTEAMEQATAAIRSADELDQPRARSDARYHLGVCLLGGGALDAARAEFEEAARWAESAHLGNCLAPAQRGLAEVDLAAGRPAEAEAIAVNAVELARASSWSPVDLAAAIITLARVELALGRPKDAIEHGTEALAINDRTGHFLGRARAHQILGEARDALQPRSGREHLWEALRMFELYGSPEATRLRR